MNRSDPFSLDGKTILVTGASSGIGRQCAIDCAKSGARVVLVARNEERLQATLNQMPGRGHGYYVFDLEQIVHEGKKFVSNIVQERGFISGLINCAGISSTVPLKLVKPEALEQMVRTNIYSAYFLTQEVCRMGNYDKVGTSIIYLSSVMGVKGENAKSMYSLTKGALISVTRSLAVELAQKHIRVNCISPGVIETPINACQPYITNPDKRAALEAKHPLGFGRTSDISYACVFLLSNAARWITGQNLVIDGGYTIL